MQPRDFCGAVCIGAVRLRLHAFVRRAYTTADMALTLRTFAGFGLVLLLLLTSLGMAVARGAPGASGRIELCTGTGPVMVDVDENGVPVGPPYICPDYALTLLAHVAAPDTVPLQVLRAPQLAYPPVSAPRSARLCPVRLARAPPLPV